MKHRCVNWLSTTCQLRNSVCCSVCVCGPLLVSYVTPSVASEGIIISCRHQLLYAIIATNGHWEITCNIARSSCSLSAAEHSTVDGRTPVLSLAAVRVLCGWSADAACSESIWGRERWKPDTHIMCHYTRLVHRFKMWNHFLVMPLLRLFKTHLKTHTCLLCGFRALSLVKFCMRFF